MTELSTELDAIGIELRRAYAGRLRRRRLVRMTASTGALLALLAATAAAAAGDLQLDPAKWTIVGGGSVDNGQAEYVHAKRVDGGGTSTFMVEHDAGMDRYQAFLLHEKVKAAADGTSPVPITTEPGALCTREQLTRAEQTALDAVRPGGSAQDAVQRAFAGDPCRGLAYAAERAEWVNAGKEPAGNLMPGVK